MGQATRTTKLLLDLSERRQGGANTGKRTFLAETVALLTAARAFYIDFFLAHAGKLAGASTMVVEVDRARIDRRIASGYCDHSTDNLEEAIRLWQAARAQRRPLALALRANAAAVVPEIAERGDTPQRTEVFGLEAQVLDVALEGERYVVSVRFTGSVAEFEASDSLREEYLTV